MSFSILKQGISFKKEKRTVKQELSQEIKQDINPFPDCRKEKAFYNKINNKINLLSKSMQDKKVSQVKITKLLEKRSVIKNLINEQLNLQIQNADDLIPICSFEEISEYFTPYP